MKDIELGAEAWYHEVKDAYSWCQQDILERDVINQQILLLNMVPYKMDVNLNMLIMLMIVKIGK